MLCKLRYSCRSTPDRTDTHWNDDAAPPILKATETNRLAVLEAYHQPGCRMPDTEGKPDFMEKFVLSEIAGKKAAIHAYDGIVWKIRSGFLTLTFGGWAIMLQSLAGRFPSTPGSLPSILVNGVMPLPEQAASRAATARTARERAVLAVFMIAVSPFGDGWVTLARPNNPPGIGRCRGARAQYR